MANRLTRRSTSKSLLCLPVPKKSRFRAALFRLPKNHTVLPHSCRSRSSCRYNIPAKSPAAAD
nr:MAG TPA: hypothetical protein [Caudoviricetes sp.]